jgi:hypothetical protein
MLDERQIVKEDLPSFQLLSAKGRLGVILFQRGKP